MLLVPMLGTLISRSHVSLQLCVPALQTLEAVTDIADHPQGQLYRRAAVVSLAAHCEHLIKFRTAAAVRKYVYFGLTLHALQERGP